MSMDILGVLAGRRQGCEHDNPYEGRMEGTLKTINGGWHDMTGVVRGLLGTGASIDEMAILFVNEYEAMRWISAAVAHEGYELFNAAKDQVRTSPINSEYEVKYWFLRTPFDYRIEVMVLGHGYSPLHSMLVGLMEDGPSASTVHASFKCSDEDNFANANATLQRGGWESAQKCDSSYGKFGYFKNNDPEQPGSWFLKPRLNLRDAA